MNEDAIRSLIFEHLGEDLGGGPSVQRLISALAERMANPSPGSPYNREGTYRFTPRDLLRFVEAEGYAGANYGMSIQGETLLQWLEAREVAVPPSTPPAS